MNLNSATFSILKKIVPVLLLTFVGLSCRHSPTALDDSAEVKGTVTQSPPGGTLISRNFSDFDCSQFKVATWYRLSRPVGAMIWHQYIGLRITSRAAAGNTPDNLRNEFQTSGLSNSSDLENMISWWNAKGESNKFAHMIASKKYTNCADFLAAVKRINKAMSESNYQNAGIRVLAMAATPVPVLGGRPCAREAQAATETWLTSSDPAKASEYCDDCTEVIPGANWTINSVTWEDSAFAKALSSDSK